MTDENSFVDLAFFTSLKSTGLDSMKNSIHPKKAGLEVQTTHSTTSSSRTREATSQTRAVAQKSEIEIEFSEKQFKNLALIQIRKQIQAIQKEHGIKIFIFRSNRATKEQTDCVTKIAESLAVENKTKILLINGLCHSQKAGSGKITPIYQVLRKSEFVNLYSMSLEGFFSNDDRVQQQKRMQELMQLFGISFNYILINQLLNKSQVVETLLSESPAQRFRLILPQSHPA
jgi:hypothetical protein